MSFLSDNTTAVVFLGSLLLLTAAQMLRIQSLPVTFAKGEFSQQEQIKIKRNIKLHIRIWQKDFGQITKGADIRVVRSIENHKPDGSRVIGRCGGRTIIVNAGHYLELPALYHELCHLNLDSSPGHSVGNWGYWNQRSRAVALAIAAIDSVVDQNNIPKIAPTIAANIVGD